jgi:hypothetical protein
MIKLIWQLTWEAAELLLAIPDFIIYVDSYENADTSTQLMPNQKAKTIGNLTKQGYNGYTQHFDNMWDSSQGQNIRARHLCHGQCQSPSRLSPHLEVRDLGTGCGTPQARI